MYEVNAHVMLDARLLSQVLSSIGVPIPAKSRDARWSDDDWEDDCDDYYPDKLLPPPLPLQR